MAVINFSDLSPALPLEGREMCCQERCFFFRELLNEFYPYLKLQL
jgi:hypothetical protein